ncbi:MAG: NAD-dependent epimerase/dehydratase family protein [Actinomycetia bacterium]|nr:NAD-dependent epimerase/dehydratase family protein [Actinomycetes bacterium]MCP4962468.1 NAD-dependent epimerase/dehydratase family protein [Actinomycetes bacterium]
MAQADLQPVNTVLVTGAAGFIGSHLCELLARQGKTVVGVDNFDPYYARLDKEHNVACVRAAGGDFRESDIRSYGDIASLIDVTRPEAIVHLAAKAGVRNSVRFPRQYFETNLLGTQNVLDSCRALGVERMVLASTSSVYGRTTTIPFIESDPCVSPLHPYAASKRSTELLAGTYAQLYGLQITVMRFFTVYGERGRPDMMPRLLLDSISNGTKVDLYEGPLERDWTHVSDIVRGLAAAVDRPLGFEVLNLGRGEPIALREFIDELQEVAGKKANLAAAPRPDSEMLSTYASTDKLRELLGVESVVPVRDGVAALWEWWQEYSTMRR